MIGQVLGPYQVLSKLGAGGMGEVYRATDTRLGRDVAIKILPPAVAADSQRLQRFQREAQLLAALNHPRIAAIYGVEESDGVRALVMELAHGSTLADRFAGGALPIDEALPIARQIADALEYAHDRGVVHRDLKPANIMIGPDGTVKILDFGLAKAVSADSPAQDATNSPTLTAAATEAGLVIGTAAYMSPEQAKGRPVDRRADIWAFGVVLYEMLTGARPYRAETITETLAAILLTEPSLDALPASTPPRVRELIARCLTKDPAERLRDIGEARIAIDRALTTPAETTGVRPAAAGSMARARWRQALPWAVTAAAIVTAGLAWLRAPSNPPRAPISRFTIALPDGAAPVLGNSPNIAISADARLLAFVLTGAGPDELFVRRTDVLDATPVPGTSGASHPFFSPDNQWLGFFADGKLKKVRLGGGTPTILAAAPDHRGGTWLAGNTIVFAPGAGEGLSSVSADGGTPQPLTRLDDSRRERTHRWPQGLPDGRTVLFTVGSVDNAEDYDDVPIDAVRVDTGARTQVLPAARMARYLPAAGHLVYAREDTLYAVPFDAGGLTTRGNPVVVVEGVHGQKTTGAASFALADDGTLFYVPGAGSGESDRVLAWLDASGKPAPLPMPAGRYVEPALSPNGRRVAVTVHVSPVADIWIYDLDRQTFSRLTFGPNHASPVWSADGTRVYYSKLLEQQTGHEQFSVQVVSKAADGTGNEEILWSHDRGVYPRSASPDGKWLLVGVADPVNLRDLYVLSLTGERTFRPYLATRHDEGVATFSPDGRFVAYSSNATVAYETYVSPFPNASLGRWQISTEGASESRWTADGRALVTRIGPRFQTAAVDTTGTFRHEAPRPFVDSTQMPFTALSGSSFALGPDGRRILLPYQLGDDRRTDLVVMLGWAREVLAASAGR